MSDVVFLDTETLGLDPDRHAVWEVAWITADGSETVRQLKLAPWQLKAADPVALEISGFRARYDAEAALWPHDVLTELWSAFSNREHICGAVPSFDEERLRRLAAGIYPHGGRGALPPVPWHYHLVDVEALAVGYLHGRSTSEGWPGDLALPWKSDDLSRRCGIEPPSDEERHTALGDARWAKRLYEQIAGGAR